MPFFRKIVLMVLCLLVVNMLLSQPNRFSKKEVSTILSNYKQSLDTIQQLILVVNDHDSSNKATVFVLEKRNSKWKIKFKNIPASIGRNGFALPEKKIEGDGKSPTGIFMLGQLFSYENKINSSLPFIQTSQEDKWIDDTNHINYNQYIKGNTTAKSFEHLFLNNIYYKYCTVIEYNTHPVIKGKGSAIFFHVADEKFSPTAGCVAINETTMEEILLWMKPNLNRAIIMGNKNNLILN